MKHIQQTTKGNCLCACVAMLTDTTIDEVEEFCELKPFHKTLYLPMLEAAKFLVHKGFWLGCAVIEPEIDKDLKLYCEVSLDCPSLVTVESQYYDDGTHAVVWDSKRKAILDPSFKTKRKITDYKKLWEWRMINRIEESLVAG